MKKKILLIIGGISAAVLGTIGIIKHNNKYSGTVALYGVPAHGRIYKNFEIEKYEGIIKGGCQNGKEKWLR